MGMGTKYNQLDLVEREKIAILKAEGKSHREIGQIIGRNHTTISRDIKRHLRNTRYKADCYIPIIADTAACWRKMTIQPKRTLKCAEIRDYVETKIVSGWSPEQVSGRLPIDKPGLSISHEAIYRYIYRKAKHLVMYLTRRHRYRYPKRRGRYKRIRIPNRIPISMRPETISNRAEFGHWESDAIVSRASKIALNVLTERKSRYLRITRLDRNDANNTSGAICRRLSKYDALARQSITYDNGGENVLHEVINKELGSKSFFCEPYHSWEKGTVENTNGLIRRDVPKRTDLANLSEEEINRIEENLNNRPRKCLGYLTPSEVFKQLGGALES